MAENVEDCQITYRDLYIQVKRMNLKNPHIFLTLALPHLNINSFRAFRVSIFYVSCFIWHYPRHTFAIIYAAGRIYKEKMIKSTKMWWQRMNTFSPSAQQLITRYRLAMERSQSMEGKDASDEESYGNI